MIGLPKITMALEKAKMISQPLRFPRNCQQIVRCHRYRTLLYRCSHASSELFQVISHGEVFLVLAEPFALPSASMCDLEWNTRQYALQNEHE